nr:MAG TPA: hypothetical protein [Caudoviricetes sp.]
MSFTQSTRISFYTVTIQKDVQSCDLCSNFKFFNDLFFAR